MKHFSSNKYLAPLFVAFLGMTGLSSCIYDKFDVDDQPEQKPYVEGNYIGMQIELPVMTRDESSDWEKFEDYIDQDSFQLIFVYGDETDTQNYDKVFKTFLSSQLSIIPIADSYQGQVKNWYVQIPLDEDFEKNIRENDFKIAVIANWPVGKENAVLADGESIHKLHHIFDDARDPYKNSSVFGFLGEDGKFSPFKDYVKSKNEDITADGADNWIRANWNPALEANKEDSYQNAGLGDYYDLWLCWNFGGNLNAVEYPGQADAWEKRNGAYLRNWIT